MASAATLEIILQAKDQASKQLGGVKGALGGIGKVAAGLAGAAAAGTLALAGGIGKLAIDAAEIPGIEGAFQGLTSTFEGGSQAMLSALQEGSAGMVTNTDLMKQYNSAAQLVGVEFAQNLPNAMGYLSKVSAATGEDMGFMMDSLIKGVGRMSPMILDNLGIQVSLAEATERAAEMFGKEAEELSKSEKQAGMMNVVLEKLDKNTADMPEVIGSAAQQWASLGTQFKNIKDDVGRAFLPVLQTLLETLGPMLSRAIDRAMPYIEQFAKWLADNLPEAIDTLQQTWETVWPIVERTVSAAWDFIQPILEKIAGWLEGDGPQALGGMQDTWENVFGVIENITGAVSEFIMDRFGVVVNWVEDNWPLIQETVETVLERAREIVETTLSDIRAFWEEHGDAIMTVVENYWEMIKTQIDTALKVILGIIKAVMQIITGDWEGAWETIKGIGDTIWEAIKSIVTNAINIVKTIIAEVLGATEATWSSIWEEIKAKVDAIWNDIKSAISTKINDILSTIKSWLNDVKTTIAGYASSLVGAGRNLIQGLINGIKEKAGEVASAAGEVVRNAIAAAKAALGIDSPSKVFIEIGGDAMAGFAIGIGDGGDIVIEAMDDVSEAVIDSASDMVDAIAGLMDSLSKLGDALAGVDVNAVGGTGFSAVTSALWRLLRWAEELRFFFLMFGRHHLPDLGDAANEAMDAANEATDAVSGLVDALGGLGDVLGDFEAGPITELTLQDITSKLWRLLRWAEDLRLFLTMFATHHLPDLGDASNDAMDAAADATDSITGFMESMIGFADVLKAIEELVNTSLDRIQIIIKLGSVKTMLENLYPVLARWATDLLPNLSEEANAAMDALNDAAQSMADMMSGLLSLADVLVAIENLVTTSLNRIQIIIKLGNVRMLLESLYPVLSNWAVDLLPDFDEASSAALDAMNDAAHTLGDLVEGLIDFNASMADIASLEVVSTASVTPVLENIKANIDAVITHLGGLAGGEMGGVSTAIGAVGEAIRILIQHIQSFAGVTVTPVVDQLKRLRDEALLTIMNITLALTNIPTDITSTIHIRLDDPFGLVTAGGGGVGLTAAPAGGGTITVSVPVNLDGREIARATARITADELRLQGVIA